MRSRRPIQAAAARRTGSGHRGGVSAFPALLLCALAGLGGCGREEAGQPPAAAPPAAAQPAAAVSGPAVYVGAAACVGCHAAEQDRWRGSHHDLAMQPADAGTVLGDFDGAEFGYAGVTSRFDRRDGEFYVTTDGPDGALAEFRIAYTFGVEPLQQYLIEFPDGRMQALGIAWDTRPAEQGGQRWFHLYPDERIDAADELHWTRPSQNWNYMCADCHSTGLRRNFDDRANRFESTWSDIDVACEACHGPGSRHVALAEAGRLEEESGLALSLAQPARHWIREPGQPTSRLAGADGQGLQVEACGRCHARRAVLRDAYVHGRPLADSFLPALLDEPLYYPDGQIRDEVYVYGSFLQSRMYAAGVVCTDCHDPHSARLKVSGDALCAQCHAPEVFAAADHHRHGDSQEAPACVDCHMPSRFYMVVDGRRDHSFRVPRPDLAESLGVTDACDACHDDRPEGWSAAAVREWLGRDASGYQQYAAVFRSAETGRADAGERLLGLLESADQPPIARATALGHLAAYPSPAGIAAAFAALDDPEPLVRIGALAALSPMPVPMKQERLAALLDDPLLAVRTEAARQLAGVPPAGVPPGIRGKLKSALAEYVRIQRENADRPESQLNLALLYAAADQPDTAEQQLRLAIRRHPDFDPAYVNLADLYRARGDQARAAEVLEAGLARRPDSASIQHSTGLLLVRTEGARAALPALERAATLAPGNTRFQYVWAVALHDTGALDEAVSVLARAHEAWPADGDVLYALAIFSRDAGDPAGAARYSRKLLELRPYDPQAAALVEELGAP